jgi:hypothetical protein
MTEPTGVTAKSSDLSLTWSFQPVAGKGRSLHYRLENLAKADVYVFDRLWRLDKASKYTIDPEPIYRFVRDGSLRLFFGAPPSRRPSTYRNVPHATRLLPGGTHERTILLTEPITEYNSYFPPPEAKDLQSVRVTRVVLILEYVVATPGLDVSPAPEDPGAFNLRNSGPILKLTSEAPTAGFDVLRRTDRFDRIALPGEPQEPLSP